KLERELPLGEGSIGWVALHRQPIFWADAAKDPRVADGARLVRRGLRYVTAYPIAMGESVLGAFAVHRAAPSPVTPETASLLGSLAAQAAIALENARLYSETARRLEETGALMTRQDQHSGVRARDPREGPVPFDRPQVDLRMTIAGQLALSLENPRLYTEVQERLREATTLMNVGQILSRPGPAAERMRQVAREVALAFGADMVGAYFLDERKEKLAPLGGYHVPPELLAWFTTRPIVLARVP